MGGALDGIVIIGALLTLGTASARTTENAGGCAFGDPAFRAELVERNKEGAVLRDDDANLYACRRGRQAFQVSKVPTTKVRVRGRWVVWAATSIETGQAFTAVYRLDLRRVRRPAPVLPGVAEPAVETGVTTDVRGTAVGRSGVFAWVAVNRAVVPVRRQLFGVDGRGVRRLINEGDLGSRLRIDRGELSWSADGRRRTTSLK